MVWEAGFAEVKLLNSIFSLLLLLTDPSLPYFFLTSKYATETLMEGDLTEYV